MHANEDDVEPIDHVRPCGRVVETPMDESARVAFVRVAHLERAALAAELEMLCLGVSFHVMRETARAAVAAAAAGSS
jgi:hypothetical protein